MEYPTIQPILYDYSLKTKKYYHTSKCSFLCDQPIYPSIFNIKKKKIEGQLARIVFWWLFFLLLKYFDNNWPLKVRTMGLENLTSIHVFQNQYGLDPSWAKSMGVEGSMGPAFYSMILSSLIYRDPFQCTVPKHLLA
jgi:hypothetical protein